jgi:hypothetical protein
MSELAPPSETQLERAAQMQQLAEWVLMDREARVEAGLPATQKGMAELFGKSEATLSAWKKDEAFQRMVSRHVRTRFGAEGLGSVINALFVTATETRGSAQVSAAKTLLSWYDRDEKAIAPEDLAQMSITDLKALAQRVLAITDDQ